MGLRSSLATSALGMARGFGNMLGCEIAVDSGGQTLDVQMVPPKKTDEIAWTDEFYVKGNLFLGDYANPIKPKAEYNEGIDNPDTVAIESSDDEAHVSIISSPRYRLYMVQDLVSQLLNPSERLTTIQWVLIGLGVALVIVLFMQIATLNAVGAF